EVERIASAASTEASQQLRLESALNPDLLGPNMSPRLGVSGAQSNPEAPSPWSPKLTIGGRVERLALATVDYSLSGTYPLSGMYGPGFEMLAQEQAAPETSPQQVEQVGSLAELTGPQGFDRRSFKATRTGLQQGTAVSTPKVTVDYASADLSKFSLAATSSATYKIELAREIANEAATEERSRRAAA
ncbi:MAG: hypothetical protein EBZ48_13860, partial [Proteobacteria bacterium]|nr:hypothetical protein [Pseudomonadota bacterium]